MKDENILFLELSKNWPPDDCVIFSRDSFAHTFGALSLLQQKSTAHPTRFYHRTIINVDTTLALHFPSKATKFLTTQAGIMSSRQVRFGQGDEPMDGGTDAMGGQTESNLRQLDWALRSQMAKRDQLRDEIARLDGRIKYYTEDMKKDEEMIREREKMVVSLKAQIKQQDINKSLLEQQYEHQRQQNIQKQNELSEKVKKIEERREMLNKLKENLPGLLEGAIDGLKKKQESIHEFRAFFGLPEMTDLTLDPSQLEGSGGEIESDVPAGHCSKDLEGRSHDKLVS